MLSQVAKVAERKFDVPISVRPVPGRCRSRPRFRRIRNGRGFVLQGNTGIFGGQPSTTPSMFTGSSASIPITTTGP